MCDTRHVFAIDVPFRWVTVLLAVFAWAFFVHPTAGQADTAVLPPDLALPWTDIHHQSALEQLLAPIASKIAGRPVAVRCEGDTDWVTLAAQRNFDPNDEAGYVDSGSYYVATNRFASSATMMELSSTVCSYLQKFAQATVKPTKCQATTSETVNVNRQRLVTRYRLVKVTTPTRINGRLYKAGRWKIPYQVDVPYSVAESRDVLATPTPCFLGTPTTTGGWCWEVPTESGAPEKSCYEVAATPPDPYWSEYSRYASAIGTVAHESIHLWQTQAGYRAPSDALVESQATCSSMQWLPHVAVQLGATPDDALAIATYYWRIRYPGYLSLKSDYAKSHPYWSADCKPGGALDIRGDKSGFWP